MIDQRETTATTADEVGDSSRPSSVVHRLTWGGETGQNHLYKPFLRGALVTVLTIGCTLGALNLAVMGFGADLSAVWTPLIQAHGYSQIFGWVGLFIMGMAYHTMTRYWLRPLRRPGLVLPAFVLVAASLVLRFISQPLAANPWAGAVLVLSALLGLAGYSLFTWAMYDTMRYGADTTGPRGYALYMASGFAWLWLGALATVGVTLYLALNRLDTIPPTWDAPYLRALLSGAIVTIILGYTWRTVPMLLGLRPRGARDAPAPLRAVFFAYTAAILCQVAGESDLPGAAAPALQAAGALVELLALGAFVWLLNLYTSPPPRKEKNPWASRAIRAAYFWLLIAAGLNAAYAVSRLLGHPVPHAFVASYHHALTVGFISLMIVGMSMRLVPVFLGVLMRHPALAGLIVVLLLTGNTVRVFTESLAYLYGQPYYFLMGLSGLIEVAGLACYAVLLWRALAQPSYGTPETASRVSSAGKTQGVR